jgi:streptogramin lyase
MRSKWIAMGTVASVWALAACSGEPTPTPQDVTSRDVAADRPTVSQDAGDGGGSADVVPGDGGSPDVSGDAGPARPCADSLDCDDQEGCTIDTCTPRGVCEYTRDTSCNSVRTGGSGRPFADEGQQGVAYDAPSMGLIVRAESRRADYLWVPNTNESTLSKWDATTGREIARYRVGLAAGECRGMCCHVNNCNMPSRVVVDGFGDAYIANRGFTMQGTVTKIAADRRDCVDRNGNGMIDTSTGPSDVRPFEQDECVLWTSNVGPVNAVLRSLAIDRGDEMTPQGYPWVGGCGGTAGHLWKLNPRTGAVLSMVAHDRCAYGAVVTPDGTLWEHSPHQSITAVDPISGRIREHIPIPPREALGGRRCGTDPMSPTTSYTYGITTDARGRIWLSGWICADSLGYDPMSRTWTRVDLSAASGFAGGGTRQHNGLGITVDSSNRVWIPVVRADNNTVMASWNADAFVSNGVVPAASVMVRDPGRPFTSPTAIGADRAGQIWIATSGDPSPLLRFNPTTSTSESLTGPNRVYTYTDFTGAVRRLVIGSGTYSEDYETCERGTYGELYWSAETPVGTTLSFAIQLANTRAALPTAPFIALGQAPRDRSPINIAARLLAAGVTNIGRFARITVTFTPVSTPMVATPILRSLSFTWRCDGVG